MPSQPSTPSQVAEGAIPGEQLARVWPSAANRGSLTLWVTPEAIAAWHLLPEGKRGRACHYSDLAVETGHLLRLAFHQPWRQTKGLLRSITALLGVSEVGDLSMVSPLLGQIKNPPHSVMADGAYDAEPVYRAIAVHQPDSPPAVIIPS